MITSADLAKIKINKTIFHDVPKRPKGETTAPVLADLETQVDARRESMLRRRIIQVLGSKSAYQIEFDQATASKVPEEVQSYTSKAQSSETFVEMSKRLALFLHEQHTGAISAGLLCVIDVVSGGRSGLALLKLEREEGAELKFLEKDGKRIFDMSVLDNLILTDGTRLFKTALFLRTGKGEDHFIGLACDNQRTVVTSDDVARFWLRYLGCRVTEEPRVTTQKWYEASVRFVNEQVLDPVVKNDLYEHIHSELKSNKKSLSPKTFMEDRLPEPYRKPYQAHLKDWGVSLQSFEKDTKDIQARLRRRAYHTEGGVSVIAPEEEANLVEVAKKQIVVHDQLLSIEHK